MYYSSKPAYVSESVKYDNGESTYSANDQGVYTKEKLCNGMCVPCRGICKT